MLWHISNDISSLLANSKLVTCLFLEQVPSSEAHFHPFGSWIGRSERLPTLVDVISVWNWTTKLLIWGYCLLSESKFELLLGC
jgi:hypothetical protein